MYAMVFCNENTKFFFGLIFFIYTEIVFGCSIYKTDIVYTHPKNFFLNEKYSKKRITNKKIIIHQKNKTVIVKKKDHKRYYFVKPNDTIYSICRLYHCPQDALLNENNIQKPYKIVVGQRILISNCIIKQDKIINTPSVKSFNIWSWPLKGKILCSFSNTEFGSKGIKILALKNNSILSSSSGEVVYIGDFFKSYGKMILIKHNKNYLSVYAYVDSILVKIKEKVNINQKIATVKLSKNNANPFYFEIRYKGEPVNPLNYLSIKDIK